MRVGEGAAMWHIPPDAMQPPFPTCNYICEVHMAGAQGLGQPVVSRSWKGREVAELRFKCGDPGLNTGSVR